jgi:hypothetical protein
VYSVSDNFGFKCENSNAHKIQQIYLIAYHLALTVMSVARLTHSVDDRGMRVRFQAGGRDFSLLHNTQIVSGAHPISDTIGTVGSFPRGKVAGALN